jgi:DNA-binding transcriptional ArsR family regulator
MVASKTGLFNKELQQQAAIFKVLAHPARLQILHYLASTKTCISGDISEVLPLGRTTVNQHLRELKNAGLIHGHISGINTNYCLTFEKINEMKKLFEEFLSEFKFTDESYCNINQ